MEHRAYLGLGSNLGDRLANLRAAIDGLCESGDVRLDLASDLAPVFETAPVGMLDAPAFFNTVARVRTHLSPQCLLEKLLKLEIRLGRNRREKWESRVIDLDLLLYDELILDSSELVLPHPHLEKRLFVLEPLCEIAPDLMHPALQKTIRELLGVRRMRGGEIPGSQVIGAHWAVGEIA